MDTRFFSSVIVATTLAFTGCATKKYVANTTAPIKGQVDQVQAQANQQGQKLDQQGKEIDQQKQRQKVKNEDLSREYHFLVGGEATHGQPQGQVNSPDRRNRPVMAGGAPVSDPACPSYSRNSPRESVQPLGQGASKKSVVRPVFF